MHVNLLRPGRPNFAVCGLALALVAGCGFDAASAAATFHVATNGNDGWSGKLAAPNAGHTDGPLASLSAAQSAVRALLQDPQKPKGGIEVRVHAGTYSLTQALEFTQQDSGTAKAPVVYRAAPGEKVRLVGGKVLPRFAAVTEPSVLERLDPSARDQVLQADLRELGLSDFGDAAGGGLELFYQDQPMPISRWPNEGFVRIVNILGKTPVDVRGTKGCVEGLFTYEGDRPSRWTQEKDAWVHGYWFWDWSDQRQRVKAIDPAQHTLEIAPPYHNYGYRKGQWFYAYNLLSEIDRPGEWYLDREKGVLYFWPPGPMDGAVTIVSVLPTLLKAKDVSYLTLQGFIFEAARDTAIQMSGGERNSILGCTIRNVGNAALSISGGSDHQVMGCDVYQCGAGGISLSGGDRTTLTPAGHVAENNHIHHYGRWRPMYSAGVSLSGVGNRARHNLIDNAPHQAISFGGNDHLIEFNEIHSVCHESNDAGAIYSGRDWTMRGTVIRYNYLHDITGFEGKGCVGVYLDDMYCGTEISGNVFRRVTSAAFVGGGRDCVIENNLFVDCKPAVHVDARAVGWAKYHADEWVKEGKERQTLSGIAYLKPPYSTRYPALPKILEEDPWAPRGNVVARNVSIGGRWDDIESKARPLIRFQENLVDADPGLLDLTGMNPRLGPDSPASKAGFQRIPAESIGLYQDDRRASWPVQHTVLPSKKR